MNRSAAVHPVARALTTAVPPVSMIADPIQRDMLMLPSLPSLPSNGDLTMMAAARQNASLESVRYHTIPIHQQQPQKLPEEVIPEADAAETTTRTLGETKQDGASTASLSHLINWK